MEPHGTACTLATEQLPRARRSWLPLAQGSWLPRAVAVAPVGPSRRIRCSTASRVRGYGQRRPRPNGGASTATSWAALTRSLRTSRAASAADLPMGPCGVQAVARAPPGSRCRRGRRPRSRSRSRTRRPTRRSERRTVAREWVSAGWVSTASRPLPAARSPPRRHPLRVVGAGWRHVAHRPSSYQLCPLRHLRPCSPPTPQMLREAP